MGSVAPTITDLVLGFVALMCAVLLLRVPGVERSWHLTFWFVGASALAGAAHHGLFRNGAGRSLACRSCSPSPTCSLPRHGCAHARNIPGWQTTSGGTFEQTLSLRKVRVGSRRWATSSPGIS